MGRIKTAQVKRVTVELIEKHPDKFKDNFNENKEILGKFAQVDSKRIRNVIAGYITRLIKAKKHTS